MLPIAYDRLVKPSQCHILFLVCKSPFLCCYTDCLHNPLFVSILVFFLHCLLAILSFLLCPCSILVFLCCTFNILVYSALSFLDCRFSILVCYLSLPQVCRMYISRSACSYYLYADDNGCIAVESYVSLSFDQ